MGNGKWEMGNGKWEMGNGKWEMGNGKWEMGNGKWEMGNGKWEMGNGKWENKKSNFPTKLLFLQIILNLMVLIFVIFYCTLLFLNTELQRTQRMRIQIIRVQN
jgi:hypothetical protein